MRAKPRLVASVPFLALLALLGWFRLPSDGAQVPNQALPLSTIPYVLGNEIGEYAGFMQSGGPPPDGIPSIDNPMFVGASAARLHPGDPVIGFVHNGEARAYPQRIMVYHEIVNDVVGGLNVAITYCPLTATAQAFSRGATTLGVSGLLLNSNLVMFDRVTGSRFSQIAATGLTGPHRGRTLDELNAYWTTWERWRAAYPDTQVLSEETGYLRSYLRDPYGTYNPLGGYYTRNRTMFPVMHESRRHQLKEMVVGARTADHSVSFVLSDLARERVQSTDRFVAVFAPGLDTGYIYEKPSADAAILVREEGMYEYEGQLYPAGALPLPALVPVEAFFFAWHAFYPASEFPS
jgi:hypothetical protein